MEGLRPLLLLLAGLLIASPAGALDLPPTAEALLARGRPYVDVRSDKEGGSGLIRAAIDIAAPRATVWAVMTDCDLAPKLVSSLKSCRILERDPQGRWDVREHISRTTFLPSVRSVFRSDYEPMERISFHREGGDLRVLEGEWRLEPHDGEMRVTYVNRIALPFRVPGWAARAALRRDVAAALLALRRESLAGAP